MRHRTSRRARAVALGLALIAMGCSDDSTTASDGDQAPATTATTTSTPGTTATTAPPEAAAVPAAFPTAALEADATGRFRVEAHDGVWWFITPDGRGLFSMGSNGVRVSGSGEYREAVEAKYPDDEAWAAAATDTLASLSFNTAGAWSGYDLLADQIPHTPILAFSDNAPEIDAPSLDDTPLAGFARPLRDFFDPAFAEQAADTAAGAVTCAGEPLCVGVFTDNELNWGPSPTQTTTYLDAYMRLPAGAPGKVALQAFLEARYDGDVDALNTTWALDLGAFDDIQDLTTLRPDLTPGQAGGEVSIEELTTGDPDDVLALIVVTDGVLDRATEAQRADRKAFRDHVAEHYYATVDAVLEDRAPGVLNLGTRFVSIFSDLEVIGIAARHVDVVSINSYEFTDGVHALIDANWQHEGYLFDRDPFSDLQTVHEATGMPIMLTEWSYRTRVPDGPPSDFPPSYPTYDTQAERAAGYVRYMEAVIDRPYVVGSHWFIYKDQPAGGRGDGENNNFGIVDIRDDLWEEIAAAMQEFNETILDRRLALAG